MPDGMPFMKQKGNPLHHLERWLPTTRAGYWAMLVEAHDPNRHVGDILLDHLRDGGQLKTPRIVEFVDHIRRDWFGEEKNAGWVKQPAGPGGRRGAGDTGPRVWQTGHWMGWFGDAEEIVRVTIIRAAELLLGLDPVDYPQRKPTDTPPGVGPLDTQARVEAEYCVSASTDPDIEVRRPAVWWICPQPRFEVAVERNADGVRVEFMTPPPRNGVLGSKYRGDDMEPFLASEPPVDPTTITDIISVVGKGGRSTAPVKTQAEATESWIIGPEIVEPWLDLAVSQANTPFTIVNPFTLMHSRGDTTTIDPTQPFGGRP